MVNFKAPWVWEKSDDSEKLLRLLDADGGLVCDFGDSTQYYPTSGIEPNEAECALIAAAPDLLAALTALAQIADAGADADDNDIAEFRAVCARADAAIRKAMGAP